MDRCSLCPGVNKCVPGNGPECNDYTFIGEAPGKDEDRKGMPFIGKTGKEVNDHYLPLAGLKRQSVRFTNAIKCLPVGHGGRLDIGRPKDVELLLTCAEHNLYNELPSPSEGKLIIPMGAFACYAIDPGIDLDLQHGIPLVTSFGTVFPMYHPAGGLHEPKKMLLIRNDWIRLGKYIKGKLKPVEDDYPDPDYGEVINADWTFLDAVKDQNRAWAFDTEITRKREPFCLTFSMYPGMGRLVMADDKESLSSLQYFLDRWIGPILFHNWLFDQEVVRAMGLRFPHRLIQDTMVKSYHLGNLPQGLKALAYRELGMRMQDFDDLVTPYAYPKVIKYLREALNHEWPKPQEDVVRDADGQWKLYKPQSMSTKLKRFFTDLSKNPNKSPFDAWDNWGDSHKQIEEVVGPWPGKCITYVPFDKVIHYACRDTDATIRLYYKQLAMRRQIRRKPQEHWGD